MSAPKCPLCGETPEYLEFGCGDGESDHIWCKCGLCTSAGSYPNGEEECWKDWKELVSKFPPIMRVCPGDNIRVRFTDGISTVLYTDLNQGKIFIKNVYGDVSYYYPDDVHSWPWELKQKGGAKQ